MKCTLRLRANGHWIQMPMVSTRGNQIGSRTNILIGSSTPFQSGSGQYDDHLQPNFVVDIPTKEDYKEVELIDYNINCHTDASKLHYRTGAGVLINVIKLSFVLARMRLCFKAPTISNRERFAIA